MHLLVQINNTPCCLLASTKRNVLNIAKLLGKYIERCKIGKAYIERYKIGEVYREM